MSERKPLHILAGRGDVAERVVVAGDPARVRQLAGYLEGARLVNENRGFLVYTGNWKGTPVTVATHGIGGGSASIVFDELAMLGAKVMVRMGTCGAMVPELNVGDVVIPTGASYKEGGTIGWYFPGDCTAAVPDYEVLNALVEQARKYGLKHLVGPVVSSDYFYVDIDEFVKTWRPRGAIAVEMECATLFTLARYRGFKAGALLVVSDATLVKKEWELATAEDLKSAVDKASRAVFDAIVSVSV